MALLPVTEVTITFTVDTKTHVELAHVLDGIEEHIRDRVNGCFVVHHDGSTIQTSTKAVG